MIYRICVSIIPRLYEIENPWEWKDGQVHQQWPRHSGSLSNWIILLIMENLLGSKAPNISIVTAERAFQRSDGTFVSGCYQSLIDNTSDVSTFPSEYPIEHFDVINPFQVMHEAPLSILSAYHTKLNRELTYQDLFGTSFQAFSPYLWVMVIFTITIFLMVLSLRLKIHRILKKSEVKFNTFYETYCHLVSQETSEYLDFEGKLISTSMTIGFFVLVNYYFNLMSTDLVVAEKPRILNSYDAIMEYNATPIFLPIFPDINEFVKSEELSVQRKFWNQFKDSFLVMDMGAADFRPILAGIGKVARQEAVFMLSSAFSEGLRKMFCQLKGAISEAQHNIDHNTWMSHDEKGKHHTIGYLMRQGTEKIPLIRRGMRRIKAAFEGNFMKYALLRGVVDMDLGVDLASSGSDEAIMCESDKLNVRDSEIDSVTTHNFGYLYLTCVSIILISFGILVLEIANILKQETRDQ